MTPQWKDGKPANTLAAMMDARKGYALSAEAKANSAGETLWCSPHCIPPVPVLTQLEAFA